MESVTADAGLKVVNYIGQTDQDGTNTSLFKGGGNKTYTDIDAPDSTFTDLKSPRTLDVVTKHIEPGRMVTVEYTIEQKQANRRRSLSTTLVTTIKRIRVEVFKADGVPNIFVVKPDGKEGYDFYASKSTILAPKAMFNENHEELSVLEAVAKHARELFGAADETSASGNLLTYSWGTVELIEQSGAVEIDRPASLDFGIDGADKVFAVVILATPKVGAQLPEGFTKEATVVNLNSTLFAPFTGDVPAKAIQDFKAAVGDNVTADMQDLCASGVITSLEREPVSTCNVSLKAALVGLAGTVVVLAWVVNHYVPNAFQLMMGDNGNE